MKVKDLSSSIRKLVSNTEERADKVQQDRKQPTQQTVEQRIPRSDAVVLDPSLRRGETTPELARADKVRAIGEQVRLGEYKVDSERSAVALVQALKL